MTEATEHKIFTTEKQLWVIMLCWWAEKIVGDHGQWVGCSPAVTVDFTLSVSLVAQSCLTLCNPMDCSTPGLLVHHQLLVMSQMNQLFASGGQSIGVTASASVLPMNVQDWFPLGLAGLNFSLSKLLLRVFPSTTVWKNQFFATRPFYGPTLTFIHDYWKHHLEVCVHEPGWAYWKCVRYS